MDDTCIVTSFANIDNLLKLMSHEDDTRSQICASKVITVAVIAAW